YINVVRARQVGAFSAAQEAEAVLQDFEDAISVNIRAVLGGFFQDGEDDILLAGTGEVFEAHLLCDGEEFPNRLLFEFRKVHWLIGVCPEIDIQDAPGGTASCWFSMRKLGFGEVPNQRKCLRNTESSSLEGC